MIPFLDLRRATGELRSEIDRALARVVDSGRYVQGAEGEAFEAEFAAFCGAEECVGVGSGLDALTLMLRALGIGEGDEVIVPSNTYIATWLAVSATGARVVPVEPRAETLNLDPARVSAAVSYRTQAILAVNLYGQQCEMGALGRIAARRGIPLLVDAAQSHGIPLGNATAAAFSFYPTKNLGALGDAGAVVTHDAGLARRIRVLGNYGAREKYVSEVRGVNSRLDPMQAAVLRVKLARLEEWNARRRVVAARYQSELWGAGELLVPGVAAECAAVWHVFAVRHPEREWLAHQLRREGIETLVHYPEPPHLSAAYRDHGFRRGDFPIAEAIAATELSLPLHPHLLAEEVERVAGAVRAAAGSQAPVASRAG